MASYFEDQFGSLIDALRGFAHAHLCHGDESAAVVWDPGSEVTVRLSLRDDEIWVIAGSGVLVRFVAASTGDFDHAGIESVIGRILAGEAVEYFGAVEPTSDDVVATGFSIGSDGWFAGGLGRAEAQFGARLAGPFARGRREG